MGHNMENKFLIGKIKKFAFLKRVVLFLLILATAMIGKYFVSDSWRNLAVGFLLGCVGVFAQFIIELLSKKQNPYQKGYDLEVKVGEKLKKLNYDFEWHVDAGFGDLDFLVKNKDISFGFEVKNWTAGMVIFENDRLKIDDRDNTDILNTLLRHCMLVRDKKFGSNSNIFIHPVLVFGDKTSINISNNKIKFNNVDITIATVKDFEKYL